MEMKFAWHSLAMALASRVFFHIQGGHRAAPPWRGSSQTEGTSQGVQLDTEEVK